MSKSDKKDDKESSKNEDMENTEGDKEKEEGDRLESCSSKTEEPPYQSPLKFFECESYASNPLMSTTFVDKYGRKVKSDFVIKKSNVIALYFLKFNCNKCANLFPILKKIHDKAGEDKINFEIVNVCFDTSKEEMMNSFRVTPGNWFAIDYDEDVRLALGYMYGILGVPQIIIINSFGDTITRNGVEEIQTLGYSALLTWM